jgi:cation transport ATPase
MEHKHQPEAQVNEVTTDHSEMNYSAMQHRHNPSMRMEGLVKEVETKNPGMMFLIGFAITVAYIYSVAIVFGLKGMDFFWELATLILIMLLGHWIEMKSIAGASKELELLVQLMPSDAHMVMPDMVHDVKTDTLKENDIILVKPGILLSPAAGAVLMTASTIVVAINASLLKVKN